MHGEGAVTDRLYQKWFAKFHAGDFLLDDAPQLGRPVEIDRDQIKTLRIMNILLCEKYLTYSKSIKLLVKMKIILDRT